MKSPLKTALLLGLILLLSACAPAAAAQPSAISLTDGLGRTLSLDKPAARIVSLAPSNTETLFAIGAGGQVIGRDDFSDFPPEAKNLPNIGGVTGNFNLEAITSLKPDLVLLAGINTPEQVKSLENIGLKVFYLSNPVDIEGMFNNLTIAARLTGHTDEAAALITKLRSRAAAVDKALAGVQTRPVVFYELDGSDASKPWTPGPGSFHDTLITRAGGRNAAANLKDAWSQISQEELIVQDPAIIILGDGQYGTTAEQVAARPGWGAIQAVKTGRILTLEDDLVSLPGPRLVEGLETLARMIHPEKFQ